MKNSNAREIKEIQISFTIDEINTIIEALGKEQFVKVYRIIEKLHVEAKKQLHTQKNEDE